MKEQIDAVQGGLVRRLQSVTRVPGAPRLASDSALVENQETGHRVVQDANDFAGLQWRNNQVYEAGGRVLTSIGVGMGVGTLLAGISEGNIGQIDDGITDLGQVAANYGASQIFDHIATPQRRFVNFSWGRLPISSGARFLATRANAIVLAGGAIIDLTAWNIELRQQAGGNQDAINDMYGWGQRTAAWKEKLNQLKADYTAKGCK